MATDKSRRDDVLAIADYLHGDKNEQQMAHSLRKYVKVVGDRDKGPSDQARESATRVTAENQRLKERIVDLERKEQELKQHRSEAIRLARANQGLRDTNVRLSMANQDLIVKHDGMVDKLADAERRAAAQQQRGDDLQTAIDNLRKERVTK